MGINFVFLAMDSSGAIFNLIAMCIDKFDPLGMTMYVVVLALEIGLFLSQGIWLLRFGKTLDQEQHQVQDEEDASCDNISVDNFQLEGK